MKDRVPLYKGRVKLVPVAGQENIYDMTRADSPQQIGTKLNKANLLTDETAAKIWPDESERPADPTPNDALAKLSEPSFEVGDILTTVRTDLDDKWLLCNGQVVYQSEYPELYTLLQSTETEVWEQFTNIAAGKNNYICSPIVYAEGYFAFLFLLTTNSPVILQLYYMSVENWGTWSVRQIANYASGTNSSDFLLKYSNGYWYTHINEAGYAYLIRSQQHNLAAAWTHCDISGSNSTMSLIVGGLVAYDEDTDCFYGAQNNTSSAGITRPCFFSVSNASITSGDPRLDRYLYTNSNSESYVSAFELCQDYLVAAISYTDAVIYSAKGQTPALLDTSAMPHDPEHSNASWVHSMSDGEHVVLINNYGNFIYTAAANIPDASSWQFVATGKVLVKMWQENGKYYLECHNGVSTGDGAPTSLDVYIVENFSDIVSLNWGTPAFQNVTDHINRTSGMSYCNSCVSVLQNTLLVCNGRSTDTVPSNFWRYLGIGKTIPSISVSEAYEYIKAKE